uniref:Cryptochrome/DNA photolyase FAD-binding domain-containing protein n=1 Tax=viral metagenome TaxID=1070528 RepID=A0A6C0H1D1_9ZZZZ
MIFIIFPTQLYNDIKILDEYKKIYLLEDTRYFTDFKFHKLKLAYHRATMKKYYDYLKTKNINVSYINFDKVTKTFYKSLKEVAFYDPYDNKLIEKLEKLLKCNILPQQQFVITNEEIISNKDLFYNNGKYRNDLFYKFMRKKLNILIKKEGKPEGDKWSFDLENRKSLPKNIKIPDLPKINKNKYITESINYINTNFNDNYGSLDNFIYPIDHNSSIDWLNSFLEKRLNSFGPYEDAVSTENDFIFHSVLTPMMNIGLLKDIEVINISYEFYKNNNIKLASFEGFIRQIIGWRTYVYSLYILEGKNMYNSNQLKNKKKISEKWWDSVKIEPIDFLINKIIKYAYVHHIERLMYLSNWMLMNNIHPKEVYRIFMEWTIDAYEWVMIPNVFGMGQFASDLMMTRPYFSSSNYILKMSNFKKGEWCKIWDSVYYSFINKHEKLLASNYATAMQVKHWKNKSKNEQQELLKIAKKYNKTI